MSDEVETQNPTLGEAFGNAVSDIVSAPGKTINNMLDDMTRSICAKVESLLNVLEDTSLSREARMEMLQAHMEDALPGEIDRLLNASPQEIAAERHAFSITCTGAEAPRP